MSVKGFVNDIIYFFGDRCMKINNEFMNTNNYVENLFSDEVINETAGKDLFAEAVKIVQGENAEGMDIGDLYNKHGALGDMEKAKQLGLASGDEDSEEMVTVYERIQIQLMTYCEDYNGTGMNIDKAKMEQVLGSASMAEAVLKASNLEKFNDNTKEYMIKNDLEPTVDNVYMAMHSAGKKQVAGLEEPSLEAAVKSKLSIDGYEINDENVKNAMWLVSRNIEVNTENMNKLSELNQIDELKALDEEALTAIMRNISYSIYAGKDAKSAYITDRYFNVEDVNEVVDLVQNVTDEELSYIKDNNLTLNAANIKKAKEADLSGVSSLQAVEFKQVIFEARIVMTQSSVFNLKRLGVEINYTEISKMTEDIKNERNKLIDMLSKTEEFEGNDVSKQMISNALDMMNSFSSLPQGIIGKVYTEEISFTMTSVYTNGVELKNQYEMAMTSYETLGTQVRRDLGDSIKKAFSNVDTLLDEIDMEINSANERAVRILGYNSMEITPENVKGVKEIATELDYLMENMTPKTAMHLIKNGINPLEDNIRDVNKMLEQINEDLGKDVETMGKFLWNLEKKNQVTAEEKNDYIELYRILNMISKNDGNVIGRVINEGKELTLKNLYSAYKSKKHQDFDYSLSDEHEISYVKKSITTFMEKAVEAESGESIVKMLDSQSFTDIATYMEMSNGNSFYKKLKDYKEADNIVEALKDELSSDGDIDDIAEKYEQLEAAGKELLENTKNSADLSYEKLQGSLLMANALKVLNAQAKKHSYIVPMEIGGELTNIHLTIKKNQKSFKNVTVSMENESLGKLSAVFSIKSSVVSGRVVSDRESTVNMINENLSVFTRAIETLQINSGEIMCFKGSVDVVNKYSESSDEGLALNTYYSVAKAFVGAIKVGLQG